MRSAESDSLVASASEMLGVRRVLIRIAPSSSFGMNSLPMRVSDAIDTKTITTAVTTIAVP